MTRSPDDTPGGWEWFDESLAPGADGEAASQPWQALADRAARCFRGEDGRHLLGHLRRATIERVLAPDVSEARLRHVEGQRQIVRHLEALVAAGRAGPRVSGPQPNPNQEEPIHE